MPTNVPPQYREAEQKFRQARKPEDKVVALQEMLRIVPKHKGTDHLRAQLRSRMSRLMDELERSTGGSKGGRADPFSLPREGGGRATFIGPPNTGKSLILSKATGARTKVAAYAQSTKEPVQGMLPYKDIHIQLVDTPPIPNPRIHSRMYGLLKTTDVFVVVVDLTADPVSQLTDVVYQLDEWGFLLFEKSDAFAPRDKARVKPVVIVCNKGDLDGALGNFLEVETQFGSKYSLVLASGQDGVGLEDLAMEIFKALNVIRIYTKSPRVRLDEFKRVKPLVMPVGSTVKEAAAQLHKDLSRGLKFAIIWGISGKFEAQRVGREHILADQDVIELHVFRRF